MIRLQHTRVISENFLCYKLDVRESVYRDTIMKVTKKMQLLLFFILFYFILFYFILFYFILFYFAVALRPNAGHGLLILEVF